MKSVHAMTRSELEQEVLKLRQFVKDCNEVSLYLKRSWRKPPKVVALDDRLNKNGLPLLSQPAGSWLFDLLKNQSLSQPLKSALEQLNG